MQNQPPIIRPHRVRQIGTFQLIAEASELGIEPGSPPPTLETTLGNGTPFRVYRRDNEKTEYRQTCGTLRLTVVNS